MPIVVSCPIKNGDFTYLCQRLPEGICIGQDWIPAATPPSLWEPMQPQGGTSSTAPNRQENRADGGQPDDQQRARGSAGLEIDLILDVIANPDMIASEAAF